MWEEEEMKELESQNLGLGSWGVVVWDCNHETKRFSVWNCNCGTQRVAVWICNRERDRVGNYFLFIRIFKFRKTIFKLWDKFRKKCDNDMAANVAQPKCSNIKCYALVFTSIYIDIDIDYITRVQL